MSLSSTNPILLSIPESLETERLVIRAPLWGDGVKVNEAVKESIEELRPRMAWDQQIPSIDESEIGVREARLRFLERSDLRLYLELKNTGQIIGCSGLHDIDWNAREFEIGYWVRSSFSGKGFITEAVDAITNYAINDLNANRIQIRIDSQNIRSVKIAERPGFTLDGILQNNGFNIAQGYLTDTMIFSKVRGVHF
jgi:RimJ/RimL family protein N-acetyltransferase